MESRYAPGTVELLIADTWGPACVLCGRRLPACMLQKPFEHDPGLLALLNDDTQRLP
jgi:hypothetical protein